MNPRHPRRLTAIAFLVVGMLGAGTPGATARDSPGWLWPVDPPRSIVRAFIAPATPYSAGHRGVDIGAANDVVVAPATGVVRFAGVVVDRPVLSIDHGGGVISSFEPVVATVSRGEPVTRGQPIGTVLAGHCASACIHVGVRVDGQYVSPLSFFGDIPRSILLPTR